MSEEIPPRRVAELAALSRAYKEAPEGHHAGQCPRCGAVSIRADEEGNG